MSIFSCKNTSEPREKKAVVAEEQDFSAYTLAGEPFSTQNVLTAEQMSEGYDNLSTWDSLEVVFRTTVESVCKKKGCWMTLDLNGDEDVTVKFKDYEFFVPKDIASKEVVVHGKAFITEVSVEEQQHLAEDGGQSPEDIATITEPKKTLSFLAEGVLIEP